MPANDLRSALLELESFARRNCERAEKAIETLKAPLLPGAKTISLIEAEARYHEAHRIYLVIQARVQEALQ